MPQGVDGQKGHPSTKVFRRKQYNINVHLCQESPDVLRDLTIVEERLIALSHPLMLIMKLRPGPALIRVSYDALRGHAIVVPRNPSRLLEILPDPSLRLERFIRVFWLGKNPPDPTAMKRYLRVRREPVPHVLQWLVQKNSLYENKVQIDYDTLNQWEDDLGPPALVEGIIHPPESDTHDHEGYSVDLEASHYENELQVAVDAATDTSTDAATDDEVVCFTASMLADSNNERLDSDRVTLEHLSALLSQHQERRQSMPASQSDSSNSERQEPIIAYRRRGRLTSQSLGGFHVLYGRLSHVVPLRTRRESRNADIGIPWTTSSGP